MIEGQRQRAGGGRRRRRKTKAETKAKTQPDLIVARRPGSPLLMKVKNRNIAASAKPKKAKENGHADDASSATLSSTRQHNGSNGSGERARRTARIVQLPASTPDDDELRRQRLLDRLVCSEGRSAISRIADELLEHQLEVPEEQDVQLQLLEHVDERRARAAIDVMARLLRSQPPIKRPILDQRLRRLELEADEQETRDKAAALRRSIRVA